MSMLLRLEVYSGHMTGIPNDCPKFQPAAAEEHANSPLGSWVQISTLPSTSFVILGQKPLPFEVQFPLG